ncbi:MAG: DNA polymerase III subunit gamma/tau, partial [Dehalococcoidia bacterium]|nr:DNA polymerase III subunit gamma/tau [Dehalococcoidia bacterium]
ALDNNTTLPLELALVDACIEPVVEKATAPATTTKQTPATTPSKHTTPVTHNTAPLAHSTATSSAHSTRAAESAPPIEQIKVSALENAGSPLEQLTANWNIIVQQVPDAVRRSAAVAMLRSAGIKPVAIENDIVVLSFKYSYHRDKIEELENKKIVAGLISQFMGKPCQIKCIYEPEENHLVREAQKLGAQIIDVEDRP